VITKRLVANIKNQVAGFKSFFGEFDSGSERTLAAWIRHASRTRIYYFNLRKEILEESGERVSNAWAICPQVRDNVWKRTLIPAVVAQLLKYLRISDLERSF
jgi:hypothetical protein